MIRFSMMRRDDGRVGIYSPEAKQAFIATIATAQASIEEMLKRGHGEVIPKTNLGIGMEFGEMSQTAWTDFTKSLKRYGAEEI